jgi:hypothetical protein
VLNGRGRRGGTTGAPRARKAPQEATEAAHESYVARTYKITVEMYRRLLEYQGRRCWGCRRARGRSKRLAVDHNHTTGEVRMLLCSTCNNVVGHYRDDPVALIRLGLALVNPPSRAAWTAEGLPEPGWWTDDPELLSMLDNG